MAVSSTAGATLYIATGSGANSSPADATAYAALTWTAIGEVENLGTFGDVANLITFTAISDSRVRKMKGSYNAGSMEVVCGRDPLDTGQAALVTASGTKYTYNFRVTANDKLDANDTNSIWYFGAKVMSGAVNLGSVDDVTKLNATLEIDTAITYVVATVVS